MTTPCIEYPQLPGLNGYYFEDSYVLGIEEKPNELSFRLDVVLTKEHAAYRTPGPKEQYCYQRAVLRFPITKRVHWVSRRNDLATDATGEIDLGNIDTFQRCNGVFKLSGNWGEVEVESRDPVVELAE
jgi:hypothetical protein